MRIPRSACLAALSLSATLWTGSAAAQGVTVDKYWQRESGTKFYEELKPFRKPDKRVMNADRSKLASLMQDLLLMMDIAATAERSEISTDKTGREICSKKRWANAYERVKAKGLKMEGWLAKAFLEEVDERIRAGCAYGMFYFNDPQNVFHLISYLPGEPVRKIREAGFQRALEFLRAHLPESKPQNEKTPDNGVVVPRFQFNPLPFMQLLDTERALDQAQGLWFLAEVLRIRPDLGKAYFSEISDVLPKLLESDSKMVRTRVLQFLAAVDTKGGRAAAESSTAEQGKKWFRRLEHDLFPPIRIVSAGRIDLYPSAELDELVKVGTRVLAMDDALPNATEKVGRTFRYGVRVNFLPKPLDQMGIPMGALIVGVNAAPTRNRAELKERLQEAIDERDKLLHDYEDHVKQARAKGEEIKRKVPVPSILVEFVHRRKARMMEYRLR